jgi:predicted Zn-dependent protease
MVSVFPYVSTALRDFMKSFARCFVKWPIGRCSLLLPLLLVAGCASFYPDSQQQQASPAVPSQAPRTTGIEPRSAAEHRQLAAMFGGEYKAPAAEQYLNQVLAKLAAADETPSPAYRVTILNSPVVNAFALPSGNIYVTRGLLALANDTSEVAAVMAHEIGHVTARHAMQREEAMKTSELRSKVTRQLQSRERSEEVTAFDKLSLASFTRQQEFDADLISVRNLGRAGYDPYGASRFLQALSRSTAMRAALLGNRASDQQPDIMSTHPSTQERIERARLAARQFGAPGVGTTDRDAYLAAINGIDFGDDPAEGIVRGRKFAHGKLGFSFTAPEGFALENTAQAVLGVAAGGSEALRLDNVRLNDEPTLEAYLATGWVAGLDQSSIQAQTINGLAAATAVATENDWKFRVAAVRMGPEVFRIIFASKALTPDVDKKFVTSINTFRRIPPQEANALKSLRLAVVPAQSGDTVASLTQRMAIADRGLDVFLLINGLQRGAAIEPGKRYKIVVE